MLSPPNPNSHSTTACNMFSYFFISKFLHKFLNQSLQLLYSTAATVDHCYEPEYILSSSGKLCNYKFRIVIMNLR